MNTDSQKRDLPDSRDPLILAIDNGTQSVRAALVDPAGNIHGLVKTPIDPYFSAHPGWAEQAPDYYWQMLCRTCGTMLDATRDLKDRITAVTITTQRSTYINLDRGGQPLRPAIVWMDNRKANAQGIIPWFTIPVLKALGLYQVIGYAVQYSRSNWIRQNQPGIWEKTHKFLFLSGYLTYRMTGEFTDSYGNMIGTIPFDVKKSSWAGERDLKWRLFSMDKDKLPALVRPTDLLGRVTELASQETGIPAGLPVIAASNDKACDVLGSGCLTPDRACISFGTTATINTHNEKYVELRPMLPPYPSAIPGQFYSEVSVVRGLWMVSWFKEEFGLQERLQAREKNVTPEELLEELLKKVPAGSMGLVCQPYWTPGPELSSSAKGSVIGFGDIHTRAHLYRAIVEGLVFALREGGEHTQKKNGVPIAEIRATGGGSTSDSILQITADIFRLPVHRPRTNETSIVGAAIDAAVGLKLFSDFASASHAMTGVSKTFTPVKENVETYDALYRKVYSRMYRRLLPLFRNIRDITGYPE